MASASWWSSLSGTLASAAKPAPVATNAQADATAKDAGSSDRGDSTASQSTTSTKTPSAETEPVSAVDLGAAGCKATLPEPALIYSGIKCRAPSPPQKSPRAASPPQQGTPAFIMPGVGAPPPSPSAAGEVCGHPFALSMPQGRGGSASFAAIPQMASPNYVASGNGSSLPQLHVSEFMKAVIEKQHDVDRFFHHAQGADIPNASLTKMVMMRTELDLLSSSISGLLCKADCAVQVQANQGLSYAEHEGQQQYMDQVARPIQIWPGIVDAVPAPYPTEVQLPEASPREPGYDYNDAAAQAPQAQATAYAEDSQQGPAIFQGFQPPPSYAWSRCYTDSASANVEKPSSAASADPLPSAEYPPAPSAEFPANGEVAAPKPKSITTSSPLASRSQEPTMKMVLTAAMEQLQRCQSECSRLRTEKKSGPTMEEFESWCQSVQTQLEAFATKMSEKLEAQQVKSKQKDETIKRLYRKLQAAEKANAELFYVQNSSPVREGSAAAAGRRGLLHDSPMLSSAQGSNSNAIALNSVSPVHLRSPRTPDDLGNQGEFDTNIADDGFSELSYGAGLLTWPPTGGPIHGRPLPGSDADADMSAAMEDDQLMFATMPLASSSSLEVPVQGTSPGRFRPSSSSTTVPGHDRNVKARRLTDQSSQKRLPEQRQAAQRAEPQNPLRREVASLRRRDTDLAGQLRTKEAQVEQLNATLREMQLVTQRQIGLYKRQLHLKDNSLQALQEELMDRSQQGPAAVGVAPPTAIVATAIGSSASTTPNFAEISAMAMGNASTPAPGPRRRQGTSTGGGSLTTAAFVPSGAGLVHSASERRTGAAGSNRAGHTPRSPDNERGRGHASSTPATAKKEMRDRSLGALPHSPRPKARDVMGSGAGHGQAEAAAARRRTMPPTAPGRSTSAEAISRASWRRRAGEGEGATSQKVLRGAPTREMGVPQTARQRR